MTKVRKLGLVSLSSLMMACGAGAETGTAGPVGESDDSIIRATSETGKDQVVMVYAIQIAGGRLQPEICSGTYTASRVVITAAHCVQSIWNNQLFVYFGDDAETDFDEFT
ncbi:MAG TPA: trypsin-like serine protease, partial [Polyangiaceae bacterium]|nr:trypsin-like serine protease [Polyangiaceae bacterium]